MVMASTLTLARQSLASPGAICLSDNAYAQIEGKLGLNVRDMGEQHLKNIEQAPQTNNGRCGREGAQCGRLGPSLREGLSTMHFSSLYVSSRRSSHDHCAP
jgi:adenylate cyclase